MRLSDVQRVYTAATVTDVALLPGVVLLGELAYVYDVAVRRLAVASNPLWRSRVGDTGVDSVRESVAALRAELERRGVVVDT